MHRILGHERPVPLADMPARGMVALWFAACGMLPLLGVLLRLNPSHTWDTYALLLVLPLLTAAGVGATFGADLFNKEAVPAFWPAARRGAWAAVLAYVVYALVPGLLLSLFLVAATPRILDNIVAALFGFAAAALGILIVLPVTFPWTVPLVIASGALAGGLVHVFRSRVTVVTLLGLALIIVLGGLFFSRSPDWQSPPLYPDATNILVSDWATVDSGTATERTIVFEVGDPPETVLSTYPRVLAEAGWQAQRGGAAPALMFRAGSNTWISSTYTLEVDVSQIASDRTQITLKVKKSMGL